MTTKNIDKLMGVQELLEAIWSKPSRPTHDWVRVQARAYLRDKKNGVKPDERRGIPCYKPKRFREFLFSEQEVRKRLGFNGAK